MHTIPRASPSINNTQHSWYPRDVDDRFIYLVRDITFSVTLLALLLGTVSVSSSLQSLNELAHTPTDSGRTAHTSGSWIVRKLKSKYAPSLVICANGVLLLLTGILWLLLYFDIGGETACDPIQRTISSLYVLSLWTTYILFEIRRIATGADSLKGVRYCIVQAVRFSTMCMPLFAIWVSCGIHLRASGIYLSDVRQCVLAISSTSALIFGVAAALLSIGHIMVFIFAIRQKSNFIMSVAGTENRIQPLATSISPHLGWNDSLARMNRNIASSQGGAFKKIEKIARRNLRLASVTVASTSVAMLITFLANMSPSTRSFFYLRQISAMTGFLDMYVNSVSMLVMTSRWQPACLKKLSARITASATARRQDDESLVSTLGGGATIISSVKFRQRSFR